MRFLFKAHCKICKRTRTLLKVHLLKSLKHAFLIKSVLYEIVKNVFFTESELTKFIKSCASYSQRTVQNCQRTRSLLKVHLLKSLKHTLLIQSALYKIVKERVLY